MLAVDVQYCTVGYVALSQLAGDDGLWQAVGFMGKGGGAEPDRPPFGSAPAFDLG